MPPFERGCGESARRATPVGMPQAARNSRRPAPEDGAGCEGAGPCWKCRRWTSPAGVVINSSSPANDRPRRKPAAVLPGGRWTSPMGLQPSSPSDTSVTEPGRWSNSMAAKRPTPSGIMRTAAAKSFEPSGTGSRAAPPGEPHLQAPNSPGWWPGQWRRSPASVTSSSPFSAHPAPTSGPSSPKPSSAKGCASTISMPPSLVGTRAPKPCGVKATALPPAGPQTRCRGSNKAGHLTLLALASFAMNALGSAGAISCSTRLGAVAPSSKRSASLPSAGRAFRSSLTAASGLRPYAPARRRW
mmetsp:Transcript_33809/g.91494  ORF Transcript_33809/g.91494 Transcript_33809/m.91494 type:complete len:300 (-) Transcript_33809:2163-3062(-)